MSVTRTFLNSHQAEFSNCVDLSTPILVEFLSKGIITDPEKWEISRERLNMHEKVDVLFRALRARSSAIIAKIPRILRKHHQEEAALIFDKFPYGSDTASISEIFPPIQGTSGSSSSSFNLETLHQVLNPNPDAPSKSRTINPRIEFNLEDCIESFTGRSAILDQLHDALKTNTKSNELTVLSQTQVISGIGGVGKSETARRYIQLYKGSYHYVIWIGAETASEIQISFRRLARQLGLRFQDTNDHNDVHTAADVIQDVYDILCTSTTLIVFDNAERLTDDGKDFGIKPYLTPPLKLGWIPPVILVTSRNRKWHPVDTKSVIELSGLADDECIDLLFTQLEISDTEENRKTAKKIKHLCEGLPLVVQQVIAFIKQENENADVLGKPQFTMENFLSSYEKRKTELLKVRPDESPTGESVFVIFQLTFAKIAANKSFGELAVKYLQTICYLPPENIPKALLPNVLEDEINIGNVTASLKLLEQYNLITGVGEFFKIHRMIQEVALETKQHFVEEGKPIFSEELHMELIERFSRFLQDFPTDTAHVYEILQCGVHLLSHLPNNVLSLPVGKFLGEKLFDMLSDYGLLNEQVSVSEILLSRAKSVDEYLNYKDMIATSYLNICQHSKGLAILKEILPMQIEMYGIRGYQVLSSQAKIAQSLKEDGKLLEALESYTDIIKIHDEVLGKAYSFTLQTQAQMANLYLLLGNHEASFTLLNKLVVISTEAYGTDAIMTLDIKVELAKALMGLGKVKECSKLCDGLILIFEQLFESDSRQMWIVKEILALNCANGGELEKGYNILSDCLKAFYSKTPPHFLQGKICLAFSLTKMNKIDEAFDVLKDIKLVVDENYKIDYNTFGQFYVALGLVHGVAGNLIEAKCSFLHAVTVLGSFLPAHRPRIKVFRLLSLLEQMQTPNFMEDEEQAKRMYKQIIQKI